MSTPLEPRQQEVLQRRTAITPLVRGIARYGTETEALDITSGTVTIDHRRVHRTTASVNLRVAAGIPTALTQLGGEIDLEAGIRTVDGDESYVPLATRLVITNITGTVRLNGTISVQAAELSDRVGRWRFEQPYTVTAPIDLAQCINLVLSNRGLPSALGSVGVTLSATRIFGLDAGKDPWAEVVDLADSFGWQLWIGRDGTPRLTQPPAEPVARSVLVLNPDINRANRPHNVVVGRWEPNDGSAPIYAIAEDDDPASPTFVGGPYGRSTRFFASTLPISQAGANQAVETLLEAEQYQGAGWRWTLPFDPTIDPGDVLTPSNDDAALWPSRVHVEAMTLDFTGSTTVDVSELP